MSVVVALKSVFDDKGIKDANKAFERMGKSVSNLGKTIVSAFAIKQVADFASGAITAASNLYAEFEGVNQVFGSAAKSVQSFADSAAKNLGISETAALNAAKQFGVFATSAGLSGSAAASFSTDLVQAAADMASFADVPVENTLDAIRSGLIGQSEPLRRFGIFLDDATVKAYAMDKGLGDAYKTMTSNEKTLLRQEVLLSQLGVQAGDFGKYADTYGNAIKTIQATFSDLTAEIGQSMLPAVEQMTLQFRDTVADMGDGASELGGKFAILSEAIGNVADTLATAFAGVDMNQVFGTIADWLTAIINGFSQIIFTASDAAKTIGMLLTGDWAGAGKQMSTFFTRYNSFVESLYRRQDLAKLSAASLTSGVNTTTLAGILAASGSATGGTGTGTGTGSATGAKKETTAERFAKVQKVIKAAQANLVKAEEAFTRTKFEINRDYEQKVAQLQDDAFKRQQDLIKQSQARITDAFKSVARTGLSDLFNAQTVSSLVTTTKQLTDRLTVTISKSVETTSLTSIDTIVKGLQDKIAASRQLLANASMLASEGFSQTFIEEVISAGTETGNAMADAILKASPETKSQLKSLYADMETLSETGANALAQNLYDSFGLATKELRDQSEAIAQELKDSLAEQNKALAQSLADAGYAFGLATKDIKDTFLSDLAQFDGWFAGLGNTIDQLLAKMAKLSGTSLQQTQAALTAADSGTILAGASVISDVAVKAVGNAAGLVVDSVNDVAGTAAYLEARIAAANKYIASASSNAIQDASAAAKVADWTTQLAGLQGAAASGSVAGTVININVKADTTQSQAMVGKTIGNIVTKYVTTGGQVLVSGNQ